MSDHIISIHNSLYLYKISYIRVPLVFMIITKFESCERLVRRKSKTIWLYSTHQIQIIIIKLIVINDCKKFPTSFIIQSFNRTIIYC